MTELSDDIADIDTAVDELKTAREEQANTRRANSNKCISMLADMQVGETLTLSPAMSVMAVPMGWIFYHTHKAGITGTFVPAPPQPQRVVKPEPSIVLQGK